MTKEQNDFIKSALSDSRALYNIPSGWIQDKDFILGLMEYPELALPAYAMLDSKMSKDRDIVRNALIQTNKIKDTYNRNVYLSTLIETEIPKEYKKEVLAHENLQEYLKQLEIEQNQQQEKERQRQIQEEQERERRRAEEEKEDKEFEKALNQAIFLISTTVYLGYITSNPVGVYANMKDAEKEKSALIYNSIKDTSERKIYTLEEYNINGAPDNKIYFVNANKENNEENISYIKYVSSSLDDVVKQYKILSNKNQLSDRYNKISIVEGNLITHELEHLNNEKIENILKGEQNMDLYREPVQTPEKEISTEQKQVTVGVSGAAGGPPDGPNNPNKEGDKEKVMELVGNNVQILYAPTWELAKDLEDIDASVEAEYGDFVKEAPITLAHHGSRSSNPAPCNAEIPEHGEINRILVSHLDLDTVGGIMAILETKPEDKEFWKAAEYIDINGPHHIHELPQDIQDKLNAFYAVEFEFRKEEPRLPRDQVVDVSDAFLKRAEAIQTILDPERNKEMIQAGRDWERETTEAVEKNLVREGHGLRVFISDGVFCNGAYYSPNLNELQKACATLNTKTNAITLSFADGGKELNAKEIMQKLFGPEAGGREGIAGSPRGEEMTEFDLSKLVIKVEAQLKQKEFDKNFETNDKIKFNITNDFINEIKENTTPEKNQKSKTWDDLVNNIKDIKEKEDVNKTDVIKDGKNHNDKKKDDVGPGES